MKIRCNITIKYENGEIAENVFGAVNVDDFDFVKSEREGKKLAAEIKGESLNSLLHTIDDYLACVTVAEKVVEHDRK